MEYIAGKWIRFDSIQSGAWFYKIDTYLASTMTNYLNKCLTYTFLKTGITHTTLRIGLVSGLDIPDLYNRLSQCDWMIGWSMYPMSINPVESRYVDIYEFGQNADYSFTHNTY